MTLGETPQALVRRGGSPPAPRYPGSIREFQSTGILAIFFYKVDFFSGLEDGTRYPASAFHGNQPHCLREPKIKAVF
jgi:hypothetical protein